MVTILADDIFNCIFLNENDRIPIQISLKFVPAAPIYNNPALEIYVCVILADGRNIVNFIAET